MKSRFTWILLATISTLSIVAVRVVANLPISEGQHLVIKTPNPISFPSNNEEIGTISSPVPDTSPVLPPSPTPSLISPSPSPIPATSAPVIPANTPAKAASSPSASPQPTTSPTVTPASTKPYRDGTFMGKSIYTPYGYVQVSSVISNGALTDIRFLSMPRGSSESSSDTEKAQPLLLQETLHLQTANVDVISGATVTSRAYIQSLTSALAKAE